jgi:hypothetical protein
MIRIGEIYRKTAMPHVYREELWLICFGESPHRDPLEALFDDEAPASCRGRRQVTGTLKLISSSKEFLVRSIGKNDQQEAD